MSTVDNGNGSTLGAGVGGRVAQLVADATVHTRERLAGHQTRVAQQVLAEFTNHVSDEIRGAIGPVWRRIAESPDTPEEFRGLFSALGNERGQAWAWLGGMLAGNALGPGLADLFSNELGPLIQGAIASNPHGIHAPSIVAGLMARGIGSNMDWEREAAKSGLGEQRLHQLVALHSSPMTMPEALEVARRGPRPSDTFITLARQAGMMPEHAERLAALLRIPLSAEQVAAMWNRNIVTTEEGRAMAESVGTTAADFDRLTLLGGDPPPVDATLLAWRRGIINESDVDRALIQGPLRKEWIDVIKNLQWVPLPVSEAADAVNQNHMSIEDATRIAEENGVRPEHFRVFIDNAGIPPGPQTVLDWINRGLITEADGLQALYESRIKNKWVPTYIQSRHETMPPETIRLMFTRGALTQDQALEKLMMRGYSPADAAIILNGASSERTAQTRDLTVAQIRELYADRAISTVDATAILTEMGFDQDEIAFMLIIADMSRTRRFQSAAMTRIRGAYLSGAFDVNAAIGLLDSLGIPAEQRDDAIALWDIERGAITKQLTLAQTQTALKKGLIGPDEFMARLSVMGYSDQDAGILLEITVPTE